MSRYKDSQLNSKKRIDSKIKEYTNINLDKRMSSYKIPHQNKPNRY